MKNCTRIITTIFWGTVIPPALTMLVWIYGLHLQPGQLVTAVSFRLYGLLSLAALIAVIIRAYLDRSRSLLCIYIGFLLLSMQGAYWYGFRFSGAVAAGLDEQLIDFYLSEPGAFISPPRLPLRVSRVEEKPPRLTLAKDGIETPLESGKSLLRDGFSFRLEGVERAPLVSVWSARGEPVDEAYLKLTSGGEQGDYIMFGRLPHRFYVRTAKAGENGEPETFRICIVRDKITIVDQTVAAGESIYFDGHYVTCRPGAPWARLLVAKQQSRLLLFSGLVLVAAGFVTVLVRRKRGGAIV